MKPYGQPNRSFKKASYPLRLQHSLMAEARSVAKSEGVSLNQLINVAVAEKLSALRTEGYFQEGIRRAECAIALRILDRAGDSIPPKNPPVRRLERWSENSPHGQAPEETKTETGELSGLAAPRFGKLKRHLEKTRALSGEAGA